MSDVHADEDYRRTALYRNARAVGVSVDAAHAENADLKQALAVTNQQVAMLAEEVRVLTDRFNILFVQSLGNGATSGDDD